MKCSTPKCKGEVRVKSSRLCTRCYAAVRRGKEPKPPRDPKNNLVPVMGQLPPRLVLLMRAWRRQTGESMSEIVRSAVAAKLGPKP